MEIILIVVFTLLLVGLGGIMVFDPELFWKLEHIWDVKGGEPTDFYIAKTRFVGLLLTVGTLFVGFILLLYRIF